MDYLGGYVWRRGSLHGHFLSYGWYALYSGVQRTSRNSKVYIYTLDRWSIGPCLFFEKDDVVRPISEIFRPVQKQCRPFLVDMRWLS